MLISIFNRVGEFFYLLQLFGIENGQTLESEFVDLTYVNTPLSIETEVTPFYTVWLTPYWGFRFSATVCSDQMG